MTETMSFRALASLTAVTLVIGSGALAQGISNNDAVAEQVGTDNEARIEQAGSFNSAGSDDDPLFQDGIFNDLDIFQLGNRNRVGLIGPGLSQTGRQNTETIFNQILIEQTSDDNTVGSVTQTSEGSIVNGANTLTIRQGGAGTNEVEVVRQIQEDGQAAQIVTVDQTGRFNRIALIDQRANSNLEDLPNEITVRMTGQSNGQTGLSGYAARVVVTDSGIVQEGGNLDGRSNGNAVDLLITGDMNRFGIRQGGSRNDVGALTINGDGNQIGLRQDGSDNDITVTPIQGNDNNIGVDQLGTNIAQISLETISSANVEPRSNSNRILVLQDGTNMFVLDLEGDDNDFTSNQDFDGALGGDNEARVRIIGNNNVGRLTQLGDNVFDLDLEGDDNNANVFDASFDAAGQTAGTFDQEGSGNQSAITVSGDANRFGFSQTGDANMMVATITGAGNQMALAQVGSNNAAFLNQAGQDNRATVVQE